MPPDCIGHPNGNGKGRMIYRLLHQHLKNIFPKCRDRLDCLRESFAFKNAADDCDVNLFSFLRQCANENLTFLAWLKNVVVKIMRLDRIAV